MKTEDNLLKEGEESYFRALFDKSPVGSVIVGMDKKFIRCNAAFCKFLAYTEEELIGKLISDVTFPDDIELGMREMRQLARGEIDSVQFQKRYLAKNGTIKWGEISISLAYDKNKKPAYFLPVIQDITERKKVAELLQKSKQFASDIISAMQDGVSVLDITGVHIDVNSALCRMTGFSREELIGQGPPHPYWPEEEYPRISAAFEQTKIREGDNFELVFKKKNGDRFPVIVSAFSIKDHLGNITNYSATVKNITERKRAEVALQESEERYRSLFRNNDSVILLINPATGDILDANHSACIFYGWSHAELCSKTIFQINMLSREKIIEEMEKARAEKRKQFFFQHHLANGEIREVEVFSTPIRFGSSMLLCSIIHDITDRKRAESEIRKLNETLEFRVAERTNQLEHINRELSFRLKEIEQFTYIASHDLQEPLLTLSNFTQLINEEYKGKLDKEGDKYIEFINRSAKRMQLLVKGLLDYSLLGKDSVKKVVDCNEIVGQILVELSDPIESSNAKITLQELPEINGFASELKILFHHLILNAIKFKRKAFSPEITISAERLPEEWVFTVSDNGIGLLEKDHEKVFGIFKQMHNRHEYEGIGMGLAYCKKIVELHGGRIWVDSTPGEGSTFKFTIPVLN